MRVALLVPCYVDQLRPRVGLAALALLERCGIEVDFPEGQTCCGQPLLTSGGRREAAALARRCVGVFAGAEHVVCPSASCAAMVVRHYRELLGPLPEVEALAARTAELCAFLAGLPAAERLRGRFPHRVGLHASCHALRALGGGPVPERPGPAPPDPARSLLGRLEGLRLVEPERPGECCGFGGTFAVDEAAVSRLMGIDRLRAHAAAEVIASTDVSCLLHLEGLARREGSRVRMLHVAEVLAEAVGAAAGEPVP